MAPIELFCLANDHGMRIEILSLGGIVAGLHVPDRDGRTENVVLGLAGAEAYRAPHPYFGALIGRCANRIAYARFTLDGRDYVLPANNGPHMLHGGPDGFDRRLWRATEVGPRDVTLSLESADGDQGFPGQLRVTVRYAIAADRNELRIDSEAVTDRPTLVNLTGHSYFNLAARGDVRAHRVSVAADAYTPVDDELIPTGEIRAVAGTAFDLRHPVTLGEILGADELRQSGGFDHNFVLRGGDGPAARVVDPGSGRVLEVWTNQPGLQLYSGNQLDGTVTGRGGVAYGRHAGLCLEPQHFPDAPHHANFPSVRLDPGTTYRSTIAYRFSVEP